MANQYLQNENIQITGTGNGGAIQAALWDDSTDTKIKDVGAPVTVGAGAPYSILINTTDPSGADFVAIGDDHSLKVQGQGGFPAVEATVSPIEVLEPHITDYPDIDWFNSGSVFHAANLCWTDSAGTEPAVLYNTDAVRGVVGKLEALDLSAAPSSPVQCTAKQATSVNKPRLRVDSNDYLCMDAYSSGGYLEAAPSATVVNDSILDFVLTVEVGAAGATGQRLYLLENVFHLTTRAGEWDLHFFGSVTKTGTILDTAIPANTKCVIRVQVSSAVEFGDTKVFVNEVEVFSAAIYKTSFPATPVSGKYSVCRRHSSSSPALKTYGLTLFREGVLTAPRQAAVYQWHKDIAGIV